MKTKRVILPLLISSLTIISGSSCLIACNPDKPTPPGPEPEPWTDETPFEYINNRTFSIERLKNGGVVWGTGWILDDSTPNNPNDYCYYIATNWHVTHGFDSLNNGTDGSYYFADNSMASDYGWIEYDDYIPFKSYEKLSFDNFLYKGETERNYFKKGIDLYVCNVNFGNYLTHAIRTKLNTLNNLRKTKGQINKFVYADDSDIIAKRKIVGGYPEKDDGSDPLEHGGGKWEYHDDITSDKLEVLDRYDAYFQYEDEGPIQYGHAIGSPDHDQYGADVSAYYKDPEPFYYYDISPQYAFKNPVAGDWMDGGASGSMLITEDCEVCGIYWGGAVDITGTYAWPYFSLFKTHNYDFTQQWLK